LLQSHVARLDAELLTRLQELRASRVRLVNAGDAERRRLERDLHDGAQARLVSVNMLLGRLKLMVEDDADATAMLDHAQSELHTGLAELRELARGIHPAVLTTHGLAPAISALARASAASVAVHHADGVMHADIAGDGIGGADPSRGSSLSGLADRVAALDGTITVDSPRRAGTIVCVDIPCAPHPAAATDERSPIARTGS
jgi:signal transduction histidine kinase